MIFLKDHIRITANDDTVVARFRNPADDLAFMKKKLGPRTVVKTKVGKAVAIGKLDIVPAVVGEKSLDAVRIQAMLMGDGIDNLLVIVIPFEKIGEAFAKLTATASELPADCDDAHKNHLILSVRNRGKLPDHRDHAVCREVT